MIIELPSMREAELLRVSAWRRRIEELHATARVLRRARIEKWKAQRRGTVNREKPSCPSTPR